MAKVKKSWVCNECGTKEPKWTGSCSGCNGWNTLVEEIEELTGVRLPHAAPAKPVKILDVKTGTFSRMHTGIGEFDRLMGNGVVAGSLTLVGGAPGIGKSTLMMHLAEGFAKAGKRVLYVCGEESAEQTGLRAQRMGVENENIYLLSETSLTQIKLQVEAIKPDLLIVDSAQIVYKTELNSAPGTVTQVREVAMECMHLAKGSGITTFLIGHVTKSGELAGPRVLEHIVDTVLEFEGDKQHGYRILRAVKNRFGPTDDIALFEMVTNGLKEVPNPSSLFLEERQKGVTGSVIVPTIEGSRAFLVEVQALSGPTAYPSPTRKAAGIDPNRLSLLLAVLEKRMRYQLYTMDIFVSVVGGLRVREPALDLGIMAALSSSFRNMSISPDVCVMGEVGLSGEVRSVPRFEARIKEAINMGFTKAIVPKKNCKNLPQPLAKKIAIHGVEVVEEAISFLF